MFPHPCTHCGMCCLATPCPAAKTLMGARHGTPCPALEWETPTTSRCGLMARPEHYLAPSAMEFIRQEIPDLPAFMGSGLGCCISARVVIGRAVHDFAALPAEIKTTSVQGVLHHNAPLIPPP